MENKLIAFIEDTKRSVDDKTWFTFDRLTFETGKATLKPESQEQLQNIAEILKAYPKVMLKLGGYTDNMGDPQSNLKLSQQRAETVMADLVKLGVEAGRLKAEGYGQEHPVADNSTEEDRAKNRWIELRATSKSGPLLKRPSPLWCDQTSFSDELAPSIASKSEQDQPSVFRLSSVIRHRLY